jgi:3-dehydroquinate dehydratase II
MANAPAETIYVLNGPNLDSLGTSEPEANGHAEFADVERLCADTAGHFGLKTDYRQSSRESELIDFIHEADANMAAGIVINAGGYSHTSIALQHALAGLKIPAVEVHVSNIHAGANFRHQSFTAKSAIATLTGFGIDGYRLAINGLAARIGVTAKA